MRRHFENFTSHRRRRTLKDATVMDTVKVVGLSIRRFFDLSCFKAEKANNRNVECVNSGKISRMGEQLLRSFYTWLGRRYNWLQILPGFFSF